MLQTSAGMKTAILAAAACFLPTWTALGEEPINGNSGLVINVNTVDPPADQINTQRAALPANEEIGSHRQMSPREMEIHRALDSLLDVPFREMPLHKLPFWITSVYSIPVFLDTGRLKEVGITGEEDVSQQLQGVPLRTGLKLMLENVNNRALVAVVDDEVLKITTREFARTKYVTRIYDLLWMGEAAKRRDSDGMGVVFLIANGTSATWRPLGKTVDDDFQQWFGGFHEPRVKPESEGVLLPVDGALMIRQTLAVHEEIDSLLRQHALTLQKLIDAESEKHAQRK